MKQMLEDRRGMSTAAIFVWIFAFLLVIGGVGWSMQMSSPTGTDVSTSTNVGAINCPSDQSWSGTVSVQNILNETGAETFDTSLYFYEVKSDGSEDALAYNEIGKAGFASTIADTTSGSVSLSCGKRYAVKMLSVSGAGGDPSLFRSIISQSGVVNAKVNDDGVFVFTAKDNSGAFTLGAHQVGVLETRVYDFVASADYILESVNDTKTDWMPTDGANWTTSTNNITGITVNSGGEYHVRLEARARVDDQNVNDRGVYVLVNADTGTWGTPTVMINGVSKSDVISTGLNPDEVKAYSGYEYAYLIGKDTKITTKSQISVDLDIFALGGQNPSGNPLDVDFSPIGSYDSVGDSNSLKVGSVDDSSSRTQVYSLHDQTFAMV